MVGAVAGMLGLSALGTVFLHQTAEGDASSWGQAYLEMFYPVDDLAMMVAALGLAYAFYALAYMLVAWTAYNQYLLVRYGPSLRPPDA